jgi:hypothetical protein
LLERPESASEVVSFVSEDESSSAEGENEVSRERFAMSTKQWRALLEGDYPATLRL